MFVAAEEEDTHEPLTYQEAVTCEDRSKSKPAMKEEMKSLRKNKTWELVDHLVGQKLVSYKWLFKIKEGIEDDMMISCKSKAEIGYTKSLFKKDFDKKELGEANKLLDIAYAVSVVSRYLANPSKNHWEAVKWILKYLRGTENVGLVYGTNHGNHVDVTGFVDSDYAKDPDKGRSITDYAFLVQGCVVSWKATLQHVVALSTTEAEYMALTEAVKEAIWLRGLLEEEVLEAKTVKVLKVGTEHIAVDALTKVFVNSNGISKKIGAEEEDTHEPLTYQEAVTCEDKSKSKAAMKEEMKSLRKNKTWERHTSIRVILALTACKDYELEQLDSKAEIGYTKSLFKKDFDKKELGEVKKLLGMKIVRDQSRKILRVSQSGYVSKILNNFRINNGKSVKMPLGGHFKLSLKDFPVRDCDVERISKMLYANSVRSLMYLMVCSRPDIAYVVSIVSRYLANPSKNHWEAVKWILKYLRGTENVGLVYGTNHGNHVDVTGFVDSDYAKDPDKEAEYMALTEAVKEAIWLRGLLEEEVLEAKTVKVLKVGTEHIAADALTKGFCLGFQVRRQQEKLLFQFVNSNGISKKIGDSALEVLPEDMEAQVKTKLNKKAHSAVILCLGNKVLREVTGETTARDFVYEFNKVVLDLANIEVKFKNEDLALLLLTSLPASYEHFVDTLLYEQEALTLRDVIAKLNSKKIKERSKAKGDDGEGLYVRGRTDRRDSCPSRGKLDILFDFLECDGDIVQLGDNKECKIRGIGKVSLMLVLKKKTVLCRFKTKGWDISVRRLEKWGMFGKKSLEFEHLCIESRISRHLTVVGTPQQNRVAKRMNRTLMDKDLWHSRLGHPADQVLNVLKNDLNLTKNTSVSVCETCHRAKQTREPFTLSDHKSVKPGELVHLDLWGPYRVSSKEGFKYFLTIVDDYSRAVWTYLLKTKDEAYKLLSVDNGSVLFSRDVGFYETVFPFKMKNTKRNDLADVEYTSDAEILTFFDNQIAPSPNDEERATPCVEGGVHPSTDAAPVQSLEEDSATHIGYNILSEGNVQDENPDLNIEASSGDHNPEEDSKLKYGIEKHVNYSKLNIANYCFATTLNKSMEPTTYYDDVKDARWVEATNNEIEALIRNNTCTLTDLPIGKKTIDNKWLYKIKYKASGQVEKYKARVVAKGFSQKEGIDFDETFSPVVKKSLLGVLYELMFLMTGPYSNWI
nr:ribonuclease H-like domain-containing protein [Tanacetum cinerariifolium]